MNKVVKKCGREHGMNQSKAGEKVTLDNVYLGGIQGLFTKPASFWANNKWSLEKTYRGDTPPKSKISNWYIINDYQCGGFIKSNIQEMRDLIKVILK